MLLFSLSLSSPLSRLVYLATLSFPLEDAVETDIAPDSWIHTALVQPPSAEDVAARSLEAYGGGRNWPCSACSSLSTLTMVRSLQRPFDVALSPVAKGLLFREADLRCVSSQAVCLLTEYRTASWPGNTRHTIQDNTI